ncbi:hypothetical protein H632_c1649p0 [Helicosporidium sp. ATCC 50920]|nr:hypothetical protein H632_c1649p0 [Helicosporidium sp. ATCC 50920]|eukprot:KDD74015.1 hypothetical protein H632_c1649p0 [Helicosporidium sp. ATCC 50920]
MAQIGLRDTLTENTYIMDAKGYGQEAQFNPEHLERELAKLLQKTLEKQQYDPRVHAQTTKELATTVRTMCEKLPYTRYKYSVLVTLGEKGAQGCHQLSRCLWDATNDGYASQTFIGESLYCTCQVYAFYFE